MKTKIAAMVNTGLRLVRWCAMTILFVALSAPLMLFHKGDTNKLIDIVKTSRWNSCRIAWVVGTYLKITGNPESAIVAFNSGVERNPDRTDIRKSLNCAYLEINDTVSALREIQELRSIAEPKESSWIQSALARIEWLRKGKSGTANPGKSWTDHDLG